MNVYRIHTKVLFRRRVYINFELTYLYIYTYAYDAVALHTAAEKYIEIWPSALKMRYDRTSKNAYILVI